MGTNDSAKKCHCERPEKGESPRPIHLTKNAERRDQFIPGALFFIFFFLIRILVPGISQAHDEPFTGPTNWGSTGLIETPTARVLSEGRYRIGVSQADPYRWFYGAVSPLRGLEINGRVTEIFDTSADYGEWVNYGNYKDKAIDVKYQLIKEGKWWPAIALGLMDPHGTRKYSSQYVVFTKQLYPFDFTIGFGNGRFGKMPLPESGDSFKAEIFTDTEDWFSNSQFFGGIEFAPCDWLSLVAEYSPIRYNEQTNDPAQPVHFQNPAPSKFNFGVRLKPADWAELDITWQRGDQIGANLSFAFEIGVPIIPIYDRPYMEDDEALKSPLEKRIIRALHYIGFSNIGVNANIDEVLITAQNDKYYYTPRAIAFALRQLEPIIPVEVKQISLILTQNGIPKVQFTALRNNISLFNSEKLTADRFLGLSKTITDLYESPPLPLSRRKWLGWGIMPSASTYLNDPSGFFKYRLGAEAWVAFLPWKGGSLITGMEAYPLNNISTSNEPLSKPVRSDKVDYIDEPVSLSRLMFDQVNKFDRELYTRLSGGILEIQYAGADAEIAKPFLDGRFMMGLSGSVVKKREPGKPLGFKDNDWKDWYTTAFLNARLNIPEQEIAIELKSGQFLAGDRGTRITVSKFINGVILSAWYSFTNTSSTFDDRYNRGYHDKGIMVTIPMFLFEGSDSKTAYSFALSPWTRDVAQDIDHFNPLFDFIGRDTGIYLNKDGSRAN